MSFFFPCTSCVFIHFHSFFSPVTYDSTDRYYKDDLNLGKLKTRLQTYSVPVSVLDLVHDSFLRIFFNMKYFDFRVTQSGSHIPKLFLYVWVRVFILSELEPWPLTFLFSRELLSIGVRSGVWSYVRFGTSDTLGMLKLTLKFHKDVTITGFPWPSSFVFNRDLWSFYKGIHFKFLHGRSVQVSVFCMFLCCDIHSR